MSKKRSATAACELVVGDCVAQLDTLPKNSVNLLCADSPYNIGKTYDNYDDNRPHDEFMSWTRVWLESAIRVLHRHGTMWVFAPDEWVSEVDVLCTRELRLHRRAHVIWAFTFGVASQRNFSRSHAHILYFTKSKTRFTFNDEPLRVPSARALRYKDKRANPAGKLPDATWMLLREQLEPYMTPDKDTWLVSRICGTYRERQGHISNQIPLPIMERIVLACSNPGDCVVDPFGGSFTTGVAAVTHGRRFWGCDISPKYVSNGRKRIEEALACS